MEQTGVSWLVDQLKDFTLVKGQWRYDLTGSTYLMSLVYQAEQIERQRIKDAIMYALDEDGHTGDWKIKFANDYITKNYPLHEPDFPTPPDL